MMKWKRKVLGYASFFLMAFSSMFALNGAHVYADGNLEAPTDLRASSENRMVLEWSAVPNATAYAVLRSEDGGKNWVWLDAATETRYVDGNAVPEKEYFYMIQGMRYENGQWTWGAYSDPLKAVLVLQPPTGLRGTAANGRVSLTWNAGASPMVGVLRSEKQNGTYEWIGVVARNSFEDATVKTDKTYYYKIYTASLVGNTWGANSASSEAVKVYVPNPRALTAPANISVENKDDKGLVVNWTPGANTTAHVVYRSENGGKSWKRLDATVSNSYVDKTAKYNVKYSYRVESMRYENGVWEAGPTADKHGNVLLPRVPEQLKVSPGAGDRAIKISWQPTGSATVFGVYRAESRNGKYEWIGSVRGNSYNDMWLTPGKVYYYKVYAAIPGANGSWYNGELSGAVSGTVQKAPTGVSAQSESFTSVRVKWNAAPGADAYQVWRRGADGKSWTWLGSTGDTSYVDSGLNLDTTYTYKVQSLNYVDYVWGVNAESQAVSGKPGFASVQNFSAKQDASDYYGIRLSWSTVKDASVYGIMRSEHGANNYQWIDAVNTNYYVDHPGVQGKTYDYKVYPAVYLDFLGGWWNGSLSSAKSASVRKASSELDGVSQVITVVGNGTVADAELTLWQKSGGRWVEQLTTRAEIGVNGFSDHTIEGDKTTPTGCYKFGTAFGNKANPGTSLNWVDVNPYHYWIDDVNSNYYNLLIDSREVPSGWRSGEHLADYVPSYNYSVNIEVNPERRKDSTSAIFLHCFSQGHYTSGCVAIEESQMRTILQRLEPDARIIIVRNKEDLLKYMEF